jgi:hypothetical protein
MRHNIFFVGLLIAFMGSATYAQKKTILKAAKIAPTVSDRQFWMDKMVRPVITSLAHDSLRIAMPKVVSKRIDNKAHRLQVQYVEVLGRVLSGIAPWLQGEGTAHKRWSYGINTGSGCCKACIMRWIPRLKITCILASVGSN